MIKINKILIILLIIVLFSCIMSTNVHAGLLDNIMKAKDFTGDSGTAPEGAANIVAELSGIALYIAAFLFVGIGMVLGIKYLIAITSGQANDIAAVKKGFVIFIVGAFITFGALGIFNLIGNVINSASTPSSDSGGGSGGGGIRVPAIEEPY